MGAALGASSEAMVTGFVVVAVGAVCAGILQSLVLREQLATAFWWAPATIGALAVVAFLVFGVQATDAGVGTAASGTVLGAMQWLVLRRRVVQAGWWVLASTAGWVVAGSLSGAFAGGLAGWTTIGVVYGVITGITLAWMLLRRPPGGSSSKSWKVSG